MLISQVRKEDGSVIVAVRAPGETARAVRGAESVYALAMEAANSGRSLRDVVDAKGLGETIDLEEA